jgi:uncharacterized membrane protein YgcG
MATIRRYGDRWRSPDVVRRRCSTRHGRAETTRSRAAFPLDAAACYDSRRFVAGAFSKTWPFVGAGRSQYSTTRLVRLSMLATVPACSDDDCARDPMLTEYAAAGSLVIAALAAAFVGLRRRRADFLSGSPAATLPHVDRSSAGGEGTYHGSHWLGGSEGGGASHGGGFDGGGGSDGGGGFDGGGGQD